MTDWVVWLVVAGGLLVAELFSLTFVLGLFAVAATVTGVLALAGLPPVAQFVAFAVIASVLWALVRPLARLQRRTAAEPTGTAALTGRRALVVETVDRDGGRVTLGGESWAARASTPESAFVSGSYVVVAEVDGATLVVTMEEN